MRLLDRYVLRGFFANYFIALSVMMGLYILIDLFFNIDEFTKDAEQPLARTIGMIVDYYGHNLALYFAQLSGVITVVAACCTAARMHRNNELTAVLASGTSLRRLAWSLIAAGLAMNALGVLDQELLIPRLADKLARPPADTEGRTVYPVWFLRDRGGALLSAQRFLPRSGEIQGLIVMHLDDLGRLLRITRADTARWDAERHAWALTVGIEERPTSAASGADAPAEGLTRRPADLYPSDLTPADIVVQQASQWRMFLSFAELDAVQRRFGNDAAFVKMKHARVTGPIVHLILLVLGLPFFLTRERVSIVVAGGRCVLLCGVCFVAAFVGQQLDFAALVADPAIPVWAPVLAFGPVCVLRFDGLKT